MGSGISDVKNSIGSMKSLFDNSSDRVNGTTQNVAQWKKDGLNDNDISQLGTTTPNGIKAARVGVKAALGGLSGLGQSQAQVPRGGGQPIIPTQPTYPPNSQMDGGQNLDYLAQLKQRFNPMFGS